MIDVRVLEAIMAAQLRVTQLVDAYERGEPSFADDTKRWLMEMQEALTTGRIPFASELSILRGNIVSAEQGAVPPDLVLRGQPSPRKLRALVAFNALRKGEEIVRTATRPLAIQIGEGEDIIRQLVALARQNGVLSEDDTDAPQAWARIVATPELRNAAAVAMTTLGAANLMVLLQRRLAA